MTRSPDAPDRNARPVRAAGGAAPSGPHAPRLLETLDEIRALLAGVKTIAVVGLSDSPDRESHTVSAYLQSQGFRIVGVNPAAREILGEPCFPSLSELPPELRGSIDLVLVFRRPEAVPPIIEEAARLGLTRIWLQLGVSSPAAIEAASRLEVTLVAEKCLRVVHGLLRSRHVPEPGGTS